MVTLLLIVNIQKHLILFLGIDALVQCSRMSASGKYH